METPRFFIQLLPIIFLTKIKHHLCGCSAVLEGGVQKLGRQELHSNVLKSPLLDGHIIHVSKLEATAYATVNISYLEINKLYPTVNAKRVTTKYGPTLLLSIRQSEAGQVQLFLPKDIVE